MTCNEVIIKKGLGVDERYYVALGGVTLAVSRPTLFKLGLAFFHIAMGNWRVDGAGERVEGLELQVYSKSSKSSKSSNHQNSGQNHTQRKEVISYGSQERHRQPEGAQAGAGGGLLH